MYKLGYKKINTTTDINGNIIQDPNATVEYENVIRLKDGVIIPLVEGNTDYQEYLEWLSDGNTPEEAD